MNNSFVLGGDIGGTHITTALVNLHTNTILPNSRVRKDVNSQASAAEIITTWIAAFKEASARVNASISKIGLAIPGPFDYSAGICKIKGQSKYEALYNLDVKALIAEKFPIAPEHILLVNDAEGFLHGEVFSGAAQGFNNVIGLTLGTGLGTATYHYGKVVDADLWGMAFLDTIAEDYLATRWFVKRYEQLTGKLIKDVKELAELVTADASLQIIFDEFGRNLGHFLCEFMQKDKSEVVVLGGNIAKAQALFLPQTEKILAEANKPVLLKQAMLGEEAPLMGAASLWKAKQVNSILALD